MVPEALFVNITRYVYAPGEGWVEIQCECSPAAARRSHCAGAKLVILQAMI
jgi:hypothetical protein